MKKKNVTGCEPAQYWSDKAKRHCRLSCIFGVASAGLGERVFETLLKLIQAVLQAPAGSPPPTNWHPEHWRIAVLVTAGVFGVWAVRIFVRLFLNNIHLMNDASERVTMVRTYLALMRCKAEPKGEGRQFVLKTLFRPGAIDPARDDGVPAGAFEALAKLIHK